MNIVEDAKKYFLDTISRSDDIFHLVSHTREMERWAWLALDKHPEANREVVLLSVWLHDVSHYTGEYGTFDHAVRSEEMARNFLNSRQIAPDVIELVTHCVRAHRCKDIQPETIEARIVAAIDSASHMTDIPYLDMAQQGKLDDAILKLERDYRDIGLLPEIKVIAEPFYVLWKSLLERYGKVFPEKK